MFYTHCKMCHLFLKSIKNVLDVCKSLHVMSFVESLNEKKFFVRRKKKIEISTNKKTLFNFI
ncbi:hypothetical protein HanIR_Chr01g0036381 [Helianthus annuus]|nr:hypothetical protein HanIR_Chr01g0036381 [Helianthus annuus]